MVFLTYNIIEVIYMELYEEILIDVLKSDEDKVTFSNSSFNAERIIESECYRTLMKIKSVLEDDSYDDSDCFEKIEAIVCEFEALGSGCKGRHDFG